MNAIMVLANKEAESLSQLRTLYHPVAIRENIFCNNLKAHKHEYFVGFEKGEMNIPFIFFNNGTSKIFIQKIPFDTNNKYLFSI